MFFFVRDAVAVSMWSIGTVINKFVVNRDGGQSKCGQYQRGQSQHGQLQRGQTGTTPTIIVDNA